MRCRKKGGSYGRSRRIIAWRGRRKTLFVGQGDARPVGLASLVLALGGLLVVTGPPAGAATGIWGTPAEIPGRRRGHLLRGELHGRHRLPTAVGRDGNDQAFYATESAGTWGAATQLTAPGRFRLTSMQSSCTGATDCTGRRT